MIPIIIICHNNHKYVDNTIKQIANINADYLQNIIIVNNSSDNITTIEYLKNLSYKVINNSNNGPWINNNCNKHIYDILPSKYIVTDPDLEFNPNLPKNFIEQMEEIMDSYDAAKVGFALSIEDHHEFYQDIYQNNKTIYQWEKPFWDFIIYNDTYVLYSAPIDTTFCLFNKNPETDISLRVADNFTAKHLPWYIDDKILNIEERFLFYINQPLISTTRNLILNHIVKNYNIIQENDNYIFINKL
jgi:hypothetical protein